MNRDSLGKLIRREDIGLLLNENGLRQGVGLEVGTYKGDFAATLASTWECVTLHTCDPWKHYPSYTDGCVLDWANNKAPADLEAYRKEAEEKLAKYPNVKIHRATGVECMKKFSGGAFSFIYLDGNHSYESVIEELRLGWTKIEPGGVLGGHDFYSRNDSEQVCGVKDAVWDFSIEIGQRPHVTQCTSYWFAK